MVDIADVRRLASNLPRAYEALVRDRVKFRVGSIVFVSFSRDEALMGFAFPKEERGVLVESDPETYLMPGAGDLRYNWVMARPDRLDLDTMRMHVLEAWGMAVPKFVVRDYFDNRS